MSGAPATAASRSTDPVLRRQKAGARYLKPRLTRGWAVCSFTRRVSRTEISQVQASDEVLASGECDRAHARPAQPGGSDLRRRRLCVRGEEPRAGDAGSVTA